MEQISSNFEQETSEMDVEKKLEKMYEHVERATKIVFQKKEAFQEKEKAEEGTLLKKPQNKIPKRIRELMRSKKNLSSKILPSTSWQKNYVTMTKLRKIEEELDESYKAQAIRCIKRNPRYF